MHRAIVGTLVLASAIMLGGCDAPANGVPLAQAQTPAPSTASVYVAESCAPSSVSCSVAGGLVERLGGEAISDGVANPVALAFDKSGDLYVSNATTVDTGNVTVYAAGSRRMLRTIAGYPGASYALALSRGDELFVVSHYKYKCCDIKGSVAVYAPGGTQLKRRLIGLGSFPGKPAFDAAGDLYQPNFYDFPGWIGVYTPGAKAPSRRISRGIGFPLQLAFDSNGKLYVLNGVFGGGTNV